MAKIFYDHLIVIDEVEDELNNLEMEREEKEEIQQLIDETIHHRVLGCILDHLPREHHEEFLEKFHQTPYDEQIIIFLQEKTPREIDIEEKIKEAVAELKKELLAEIKGKKN
ncbi:hypothetical protein HY404_01570 [Candidatus Microgenomates bacterium]|nr:hypothetical protein [Candidatus Microgenomates bacterium]